MGIFNCFKACLDKNKDGKVDKEEVKEALEMVEGAIETVAEALEEANAANADQGTSAGEKKESLHSPRKVTPR